LWAQSPRGNTAFNSYSGPFHAGNTRRTYPLAVYGFIMPGIDNYAHAGGFLGGYLTAMLLNPMKPERGDHVLGAIVCLALSLASIVASVLTAIPRI